MKKISVFLLCLIFLLGAVSCTAPSDRDPYKDIIDKYTELVLAKSQEQPLEEPEDSSDEIEVALYEIVRDSTDPSIMGYATKDINSDGIDELVLLDKQQGLYALFTVRGNTPVLLLRMDKMYYAAITPDGTIYANEYIRDKSDRTQVKTIVDGKLEGLEYGSETDGEIVTYYKTENGVRTEITKEEMVQLDRTFTFSIMISPRDETKTTGFRFVPIVTDASQGTAPIPDFTSYDGIISAYKIMVESFSEYQEVSWINGEFDRLFTINDNETYDIFHQIFWGGIRIMPTETYFGQEYASDGDNSYGYAKKDLNGDGVEELILLNDNYEIFALFTMKDGKAVFLDGLYGAWIDENGRIYKDVATGGLVSRDSEVYVYEIDGGELKNVIAVGYRVNFYLQKEGWYKIDGNTRTDISAEEGEAAYAVYDIRPLGYCNEEYTRTFSGIEFIPLMEETFAGEKHINTYCNSGHVNGDVLTVSEVSENDVTVSVELCWTDGDFDPDTNPEPEEHTTKLSFTAVRNGNRYEFEQDGVSGYLEFAVNSAWVVVTDSQNEYVSCRAYLFDYPQN